MPSLYNCGVISVFFFLDTNMSVFSPNIISTPIGSPYQHQPYSPVSNISQLPNQNLDMTSPYHISPKKGVGFTVNAPFVYSCKHNGLYLYLARILRPIWNQHCIQKMSPDVKNKFVSLFYIFCS